MSGIKNSPYGKRLRASHNDDEGPQRTRQRVNPIFGVAPLSLDTSHASTSASTSTSESGPLTPEPAVSRDYNDRFVPYRDTGDMRTSYNLMEEGGGPKTPSKSRLIPSESDAQREQANAIFTSILQSEVTPPDPPSSPHRSGSATAGGSTAAAAPSTPSRKRLFTFNSPSASRSNPSTPHSSRRLDTPTDEAYSMSPVRASSRALLESPRRQLRNVCKTPYRVLDAPELADDFYLNLVDWSSTNVLGVGLGSCVYLWTAHTAAVSKLCDLRDANDTVSSVAWVQKGTTLAVGTLSGRILIYDAHSLSLIRTYSHSHADRVGALAWSTHVLSSGSRDHMVHHRDVRDKDPGPFRRCAGHRQEVCGLRWSGDGGPGAAMLASGGNDNKVCIWDLRGSGVGGSRRRAGTGRGSSPVRARSAGGGSLSLSGVVSGGSSVSVLAGLKSDRISATRISGIVSTGGAGLSALMANGGTSPSANGINGNGNLNLLNSILDDQELGDQPLWKFHEHTAAVKALAWNPHVGGVLATGGGTQDKTIRFWNVANGTMLNELDTGSQVCNLTWSTNSHELVSTHGFSSTTAQNQICIWRYPSLNMVASLTGHTHRVLYLAMSPDGETIVTGAGDETLRFWNAFPKREDVSASRGDSRLDFGKLIR